MVQTIISDTKYNGHISTFHLFQESKNFVTHTIYLTVNIFLIDLQEILMPFWVSTELENFICHKG